MFSEIYFDNGSTTRPFEKVLTEYSRVSMEFYGNPSSLHKKGIEAEKLMEQARRTIAGSLMAEPEEILFTSGGTEANNLAILGYIKSNPRKGKHLVTTQIEHPSILEVYKSLSKEGYEVSILPVDPSGYPDEELLARTVTKNTSLVSFTLVNNEVGFILPEHILRIIKNKNPEAAIHLDAVQA